MPYPSRSRLACRVRSLSVAALILAGACAPAWAQALKTGLWDYALQTRRGDGPEMNLAQILASLPASARPQIEARLREQGMSLSADGGLQICLDAQSLAGGHPPLHLAGRCDVQWSHPDADDWGFHYECTTPSADGSGTLHVDSPTAYRSDYKVISPDGRVSGHAQAHWVSASCGAVPALRDPR